MKKFLSIFLVACMLLSMSILAFAEDDGTNAELEEAGYKPISDEETLQSRGSGKWYLTNDIVVKNGKGTNLLDSIIDGNGHTIIFEGGYNIINWGKNLEIRNLNLQGTINFTNYDADDGDSAHYGALIIHGVTDKCIVQNVHADLDITVDPTANTTTPVGQNRGAVGGIFGKIDNGIFGATLENISFKGSITLNGVMANGGEDYRAVGGVAGWGCGNMTATNIKSDAVIVNNATGVTGLGGVFGKSGNGTYTNCSFTGSVTNNGEVEKGIGGVFGQLVESPSLAGIVNEGEIKNLSTTDTAVTGGVVGAYDGNLVSASVSQVVNKGKVTGNNGAGGIFGRLSTGAEFATEADPGLTLTALRNQGEVSSPMFAGGIIGELIGPTAECVITFEKIINVGKISATAEEAEGVAGIVGVSPEASDYAYSFSVSNVFNTGALSGANLTPLMRINDEWLVNDAENNYYTNTVTGDHFGDKAEGALVAELVKDIVFIKVDTYALTLAISAVEGKVEADYTPETWKALTDAIAAGEALLGTGTQDEVDAAAKAINDAVAGLKFKELDRTKLDELIAQAKAIDKDLYRGDTYRQVTKALEEANKTLSKQSAIDEAFEELKEAIDGLILKDTEPSAGGNDDNPSGGDNNAAGNNGTTAPDTAATADGKTDGEKGGCGSAIAATAVVLTAVLALGTGVALKKKED